MKPDHTSITPGETDPETLGDSAAPRIDSPPDPSVRRSAARPDLQPRQRAGEVLPPQCKCGQPQDPIDPTRCRWKHPWKGVQIGPQTIATAGNFKAATDLRRTDRIPPELAFLHADVAAFLDGSIADEGGASEVPTRRKALHEYRARVHRRILVLDNWLELKGVVDQFGRLRTSFLTQLASLIATAVRIDRELGLARGAKRIERLDDLIKQYPPADRDA